MNPVPEGKSLRYRLTAVGGYRDVVELKRLQDVKVNAKAKVARMRFIKPCQNCCCFGHCSIDCQNGEVLAEGGCVYPKLMEMLNDLSLPDGWIDHGSHWSNMRRKYCQ